MATSSSSSDSSENAEYMFHDIGLSVLMFKSFNKMRENNDLCDVSLRVGNIIIEAHRLVLALASPYFFDKFNSVIVGKSNSEIELHGIDSYALQLLVDFSYTKQVRITTYNVQKLFSASTFLQYSSVRDACYTFLLQNLCPTNCLGAWQLGETHSCNELSIQSRGYALQHFEAVAKSVEFLLLSFSEVESLVSDDKLSVQSENQVFVAVMQWIKHDFPERSQYVGLLMGHLRLIQMSKEFLAQVVCREPLINNELSCTKLLLNAMMYLLFPEERSNLSSKQMEQRTGALIP